MRFLFRVDASITLGSGHVMRCLTLAGALKELGHVCIFVCRDLKGNLVEFIQGKGFEAAMLPTSGFVEDFELDDADHVAQFMGTQRSFDWVVVDHYRLSSVWETRISSDSIKVIVIDDLADRPHVADILLDQNEYLGKETRYQGLLPDTCHALLGARFALLRPDFAVQRQLLRSRSGQVESILVFLGGADEKNLTGLVLSVLSQEEFSHLSVTVVTGGQNPHRSAIDVLCQRRPNTVHLTQVDNMAQLMAESDLAIGASGSTNWERCCLGLPAVLWSVADNQQELLESLARKGAALAPDWKEGNDAEILKAHLSTVLHNSHLTQSMTDAGKALCDGRGVERVCRALCRPVLSLRDVSEDDAAMMFEWRNDSRVRGVSLTSKLIDWDGHLSWLQDTLNNSDRQLYVAEDRGTAVGVIRFDRDGDAAEVSLYLNPNEAGKGYGKELLAAGEERLSLTWPEILKVNATVLEGNVPSKRLFESSGYQLIQREYTKRVKRTWT